MTTGRKLPLDGCHIAAGVDGDSDWAGWSEDERFQITNRNLKEEGFEPLDTAEDMREAVRRSVQNVRLAWIELRHGKQSHWSATRTQHAG